MKVECPERYEEDESFLFGAQVAATLIRLSHHQQAVAKLQIQQTLLDVEFGGKTD